jgi:hypothetical protein
MSIDLRIPVTAEQKQAIMAAVADEPEGFAAWARGVLMSAAARKTNGRRVSAARTGASRGS